MHDDLFAEESGSKLSLNDLKAIAVRRRWWFLAPLFLLGLLSFAVARRWPYVYRSEALVLIVQQRVPEQYVTPNVVSNLEDRLQSMTQQILSRTRLERLIEQFNLYPRERAHEIMEDVVDKMRREIHITPVQAPDKPDQLTAFRISYGATNPHIAQQITNELTSLFVEDNLQARTQASIGTTQFLESQLEQAAKDLSAQEQQEREFKMRFLGELPEQEQTNLQILSSLEEQLNASGDALARAEQQKVYLQSMRDSYLSKGRALTTDAEEVALTPLQSAEATLVGLRKKLASLEAVYTPRYPDVVALKSEIGRWETIEASLKNGSGGSSSAVANEASAAKNAGDGKQTAGKASQADAEGGPDTVLTQVESQLKATDLEIADRQKEIAAIRGRIKEVQGHLSLTPVREQQLADVTRAFENSREYYQSLLNKKMQSELATNLEERQEGEQFRILDPASLPEKAEQPNRSEIIAAGWALGLILGVGLAVMREFSDQTVRKEEDLEATKLRVLTHIPTLRTAREQRWHARRRWIERLAVAGLILLSVAAGLVGRFGS